MKFETITEAQEEKLRKRNLLFSSFHHSKI